VHAAALDVLQHLEMIGGDLRVAQDYENISTTARPSTRRWPQTMSAVEQGGPILARGRGLGCNDTACFEDSPARRAAACVKFQLLQSRRQDKEFGCVVSASSG
jgi:hypothetical protein